MYRGELWFPPRLRRDLGLRQLAEPHIALAGALGLAQLVIERCEQLVGGLLMNVSQ